MQLGVAATCDVTRLKESVAVKAIAAAQKLAKVDSYLMQAFDNKWEIVLHKAQVRVFFF